MWLFIWKKYEHSWLATAISFAGNIAVAVGAVAAAIALSRLVPGKAGGVLAVLAGVALYVVLRIALNRLTDRIAEAHLHSSVDRSIRKQRRNDEEGAARDAQLLEALSHETDQDRLLKAVRESLTVRMGYTSGIKFQQSAEGAKRLDEAHLLSLLDWYGRYAFNRMVQKQRRKDGEAMDVTAERMDQLIGYVPDAAKRDELRAYYYLD